MESGDSAGEKSTTLWCCPLVLPSIIRASKFFATELIRMMQTGVTPLSLSDASRGKHLAN